MDITAIKGFSTVLVQLLLPSLAQDALKIDVFLTHQPSSTPPSNGTISGLVFVHCSSVTAFLRASNFGQTF